MSRLIAFLARMSLPCLVYYVLAAMPVVLRAADTTPPTIISTNPAPGAVLSNFTQITFLFSEPVVGVEADDLQINGDGAASVTGTGGTNFIFSFTQPPAGTVYFFWDADHGITDQAGNPFQPGASWTYTLLDTVPPSISLLSPPAGAMVTRFTQLEITFSEPVRNLDAADLLINGQAAQSVSGVGGGPYLFTFPEPAQGTVTLSFAAGHGITDLSSNAFVANPWNLTLNSNAVPGNVVINEFLASQVSTNGLKDEDGQFSDWIELYNRGTNVVNLAGWSLTDNPSDPGEWTFPATNIGAGQYLVVFASGKDRRVPGARLHTNFELAQDGEYLGLFGPELPRVAVSEFAPSYPTQRGDYSYGYDASNNVKYFATPTPGAANTNSLISGIAESVHFSAPHGFYSTPLPLILTTPTAGANIRYTVNGSEPTLSSGLDYTNGVNGLTITQTVVIRAAAFKTNLLSSTVESRTYIFVESTIHQPAAPVGYPTGYVWEPTVGQVQTGARAYFEMDQKVVTNSLYSNAVRQALIAIPTISVASAIDGLFGPTNGIYSHPESRGAGWERPNSFEIIYPDGSSPGLSMNCGLQIQGGSSRQPGKNAKHSFRVQFKDDYGNTKLSWPLYDDTSVVDYNTVVFDGGINYWWHYVGTSGPEDQRQRAQLVRDQFSSDLQIAMGWPSFHGKFYHLYVNGLYWGLHYLHDRTDDAWAASYYGGSKSDYDVEKNTTFGFEVVAGDPSYTNWTAMMALANSGLANNSQYEQIQQYVDIDALCDYMIVNFWIANDDWPQHNWYASRKRNGDGLWRFQTWDAEHVLKNTGYYTKFDENDANGPAQIYQNLRSNAEFRLRFADRLQKQMLTPGGVLFVDTNSPSFDPAHPERNRPAALYMKRITEITNAIVAESARWGGYVGANSPPNGYPGTNYFRNDQWLKELNSLLSISNVGYASFNFFNTRGVGALAQFRSRSLYPALNGVAFSQYGGRVAAGYQLYMTNGAGAGTIYYTTNGVDPRVYASGAVAGTAQPYTNGIPVILNSTVTVKARALSNTVWSAVTEATFMVGGLGVPIRITELMYNPIGGSAYEFLELQNVGTTSLDLGGYFFSGITFSFPAATHLNAGGRLVLASGLDTNSWKARYPGVAVAGWYSGSLNNAGEKISLFDSHSILVLSVDYQPGNGWPAQAAGGGYSIEMIDPNGDPDDPANWRASAAVNGTPGLPPATVTPPVVVLNEVMALNLTTTNNGGTYPDWVELYNSGGSQVDLAGWSLTDDGNARKFVFPANTPLGAGGYLVVWCDTNSAAPGLHTGFALSHTGESIYLFDQNTNRVDAISFGPQIADYTIGRVAGAWQLNTPTPGAANAPTTLASVTNISINEWLANSPAGTSDWFELYNKSATLPVSLQNIYLANSNVLSQLHALSFLPPNGYLQVFADEGVGPNHVDFKLAKEGDAIILYDATGAELSRVTFGAQVAGVSQGRLPDGSANITSFPGTVSPGASNYVVNYTGPRLNEVLAKNVRATTNLITGLVSDWVEIFNPSTNAFSMAGWSLSIDQASAGQWYFPTGLTLAAGAYLVVWCDSSQPPSTVFNTTNLNTGNSISAQSGGVYLFQGTVGSAGAAQLVDSVEFGFQVADVSLGRSGSNWRLLSTPTPGATNAAPATLGSVQNLRINEWLAAPLSGNDWVELYNLDPLPVDISGIYLTDDPTLGGETNSVASPLSFIGGNSWVQWIADGKLSKGRDHVAFALDDLGEALRLYSTNLTLIDGVDFGIQMPGVSQGRFLDGGTTLVSFPIPTPADANYLPLNNVVINEALTHTDPPLEDAIELFNPVQASVNIGGWFLSNTRSNLKKYRIPNGTTLNYGAFAVFYENQFNTTNPGTPFTLNSAEGDEVWLSAADGSGNLTGYRASVSFGAAANGVSFGRFDTSLGPDFPAMLQRTFGVDNPSSVTEFRTGAGKTNSGPKVGPIVINEIMYHPPDIGGVDDSVDEYIELLNISDSTVNLYDPDHATNVWVLRDGVDFAFPPGTNIASGAYVLVVNFDPIGNPSQAASFRAKYSVPGGVALYGPYSGKLDNGGEAIELARPDAPQAPPHPDAGFIPYILVDRVAYSDSDPWGSGADGNTNALVSLQRILPTLYGNEPLNWVAALTTAGATNNPAYLALPVITQQPQDRGGLPGITLTFSVTATGPGPLSYQWRFNGLPIRNANSSTLIIDNIQPANEGTYSVLVGNPAGAVLSASAILAVQAPPSINQQPQHQVASLGNPAAFTVLASGGGLTYRWFFNGTNLPGATSNVLSIASVQSGNIGPYFVTVSNISGVVTSATAYLVVNAPTVSTDPQNQHVHVGDNIALTVGVSGDQPLTYQWRKNGTNVINGTNASLAFSSVQVPDRGDYVAIISNPAGSATSAVATISFYVTISQQPQGLNVRPPTNVTFTVSAVGTGPLLYQWRFNSLGTSVWQNINGATASTLTINNAQLTNNGDYSVVVTDDFGSVTSSNATFNVLVDPIIVQAPTSQSAMPGQSATFTVAVTNATLPISYQWVKFVGSVLITNITLYATNCSFVISNAQASDGINYRVTCTNVAGSRTSGSFALFVGPAITAQPTNRAVNAGSNTIFSVTAVGSGNATLRYQWRLFGTNLPTITNSTYTISGVQPGQAGDYSVVVTNTGGAVTSQVAVLTVRQQPAIVSDPQDQTVIVGDTAFFSVGATGGELAYQWRFNDSAMASQTSSNLTIVSAQEANSGGYSVLVTNVLGAVTSRVATLTVVIRPRLSDPQFLPSGDFQLFLTGSSNRTYDVDYTTDLLGWSNLTTIIYTNGPAPIVDSTATNISRIYRAKMR